jgi:Tol biopolymer transport system component
MKQHALLCLLIITISLFPKVASSALTEDPALNWRTLQSEHFEIHFHDGEKNLAREVADMSERIHRKLTKALNWIPKSRTQILLTDRFDYTNGYAYDIPRNWMQLNVSPPDSFSSLDDYNNWLELLITHEYTHVLHFDKNSGVLAILRHVFGRFLLLFPNQLQPPWLIEGLATFEETDTKQGTGRGQNSYFRMLMRLEVENGIKPLSEVNQPLVSWPMNTTRYLYGVYFYQFLEARYGKEKIQALIDNYSDNLLPFSINRNSRAVLGKSMDELWNEFSAYLRQEFNPEIRKIKQNQISNDKQVTHSGYFINTPKVTATGDVFFTQENMQSEPHLMVLRKGDKQPHIVTDSRGRYFDYHPRSGIVITELDNFKNANIFSDLYHIDPVTGLKTRLTWGRRYRFACWSPDGQEILAVHYQLGEYALHLLNKSGKLLKILWQGKDKSVLGPPDWSPNGDQVIMSVWRPATQWNLETFNVQTRKWKRLTSTSYIETTPQFSADGKSILFSADYNGVFNIHRLNLASGSLSTMTNVIGGVFSPSPTSDGKQIYYIADGRNGFDLFKLDTGSVKPTPVKPINTISQKIVTTTTKKKTPTADKKNYLVSDYNAIKYLVPTGWFPYFYYGDDRAEIGANTWGSDPIKRHSYNLIAAYDVNNNWATGKLDYLYDRWNPTLKFSLERQISTYRRPNNTIERYRNLDSFTAEAVWPLLSYERQWLLHVGVIAKRESDKKILSNLGPRKATNNDLTGIALNYNSSHRYPISISRNNGRQVRIIEEDNNLLDSAYSGQTFTLDWHEFIDMPGQHVLALRGVFGYGTGQPEKFQLGGTLEHSVPTTPNVAAYAATENIFGVRNYPLLGYPTGRSDLSGRRMFLADLEWRFPIALIERGLMSPPIGIHQLYGKFFYNWGDTWDRGYGVPELRRGAGAELTTELVAGYWIPLDVSLGFARGFDTGGEDQAYINAHLSF